MNICVKKENLLPLLGQVQGILEKRNSLPILSNVLLESDKQGGRILASDSELSFSGCFEGISKKEGQVVTNGRKLFEIIKELPSGDITLVCEKNNSVRIKGKNSNFCIHGLSANDFPPFPSFKQNKSYRISVTDLLDIIDKTLYCVSLDESRYHLTGVFCEQISPSTCRFVATDGHRMSFVDLLRKDLNDFKDGVIIPKKGLQEIKKILSSAESGEELELSLDKPRLIFKFKNQTLVIRLIEGRYPDYNQIIPKDKGKKIILNKEIFLLALKRISVLTNARFRGVNFIFRKNKLVLEISQPEIGEAFEEIDCKYEGDEIKVRFNAKYVLDILYTIQEKNIIISLKDGVSSGVIQGEGNALYKTIVMPMKF